MKSALRHSLKLPALGGVLLPLVLGAGACGTEAPLPTGTAGTGTGGSTVIPSGGSAGTNAAAGSSTTAGSASTTAGTGNSTGGVAGTPGTGGSGTTAGTGGASGGTAPAGGSGGAAGTSSGGGSGGSGGDLKETVAGMLNGAMLVGACLNDTAKSVCSTSDNGCPPENADFALSGKITTDKTITLGGDPAKTYTITLHVQGEVEAKSYDGAQDQSSQGASPKADGFAVGGTPTHQDYYNVYMVRVSDPKKDYFLNSLNPPGVSNHTTYGIDYTAKITAKGGASLRLVAADRNCAMIKNCGPMVNDGSQCTAPIILQNIDPVASSKNPSFDFSKAFNGQWIVMVVTEVTEG
ncbi:MAG TPA: hypothetical protein VHB79_08165 [Polyangiaceae bacterium]|nr:hypothetical protein [Polyangiaceae bacterium]